MLGAVLPDLVPAGVGAPQPGRVGRARRPAAEHLGALVDDLATLGPRGVAGGTTCTRRWRRRRVARPLAGLPVPLQVRWRGAVGARLADARAVRRPRQCSACAPSTPTLRIRCCCASVRSRPIRDAVLADDRVRAAVENSYDADEPAEVAEAVLRLVSAAHLRAGDEPWLAELALPADDGEYVRGRRTAYATGVIGSDRRPTTRRSASSTAALIERWGATVLTAVGVLETFARGTRPTM